jgi:DNA phosphorothioation-dependent restriction protein DptG
VRSNFEEKLNKLDDYEEYMPFQDFISELYEKDLIIQSDRDSYLSEKLNK